MLDASASERPTRLSESLHSAGVRALCDIDWQAIAAWVQALGSIGAIWAAGRVVVRQQRLSREQVIEGVLAAIGIAHDLLTEAAATARDQEQKNGFRTFDPERFTDALAWLISATPHVVGDLRLVELVSEYPPMLRKAYGEVARAVALAKDGRQTPGNLWDELYDAEQRSVGFYAEAGRILTLAQQRTREWLWR